LVVFADSATSAPGLHTGFNIGGDGGGLYLFANVANGSGLLDSVTFGLQITDLSLGRLADGSWTLCQPTFGATNVPVGLGDPRGLKINEWLADAQFQAANDFVEIYNSNSLPVPLGGL